ncbi:MAG: transporter [Chloroflexi bacterium]|nr:MAG: transporter [Chloroflexota bacterium]
MQIQSPDLGRKIKIPSMIDLLEANPLLLLFLVASLGFGVGQLRFQGSNLGVAAVLFVGLAFGALDPALQIPSTILNIGLVLFVYTIGLSNGASFFGSFRSEGSRNALYIVSMMAVPALMLVLVFFFFPLSAAGIAGIFAGMSNSSPALASLLDYVTTNVTPTLADTAVSETVVGFSIIYPVGVLGRMLLIVVTKKMWRIDFAAEAFALRKQYPIAQELSYRTIKITQTAVTDHPLRELQRDHEWDVVFGRIYREQQARLISGDTEFQMGDQIVIAGTHERMEAVTEDMGETAVADLYHERAVYAVRRLFVSNPEITGERIAALDLKEKYGAIVSHIRRGDIELLANNDAVLELGDRIRILAPRREIPHLVELFGDSYANISQINWLSFGLGIAMGLLLGQVPFPLPGGLTFRLGLAGGPLIVALVLGAVRRTGPIVWQMPYSANLTLRQLGLICLLATVGVRSGNALVTAFTGSVGWWMLGVGTAVTLLSTLIALVVGHKWLKIPYSLVIGMVSPQPAVLGFALEQADNQLPNVGYTLMFPFAIIINVTLAQLLLIILNGL